ncbi:MAG: Gfo/Idh/MocA family oxidoreductase [Phycisphaerae bacterium]|nr:Gfo/Idh/MocA family oxidoreductase [Phycisphaerae bacterium]
MGKQCIRIGVVGTGFGRYHMDGFGKVDGAYVHAVCDLNEEEARAFADQYGAKYVFTDFRKMAAMDELDAISIAVPNCFHAPIAIEALTRGKHVLVEKPMALNPKEAEAMVAAARKAGKRLMVEQALRFKEETQLLRAYYDRGVFGDVYFAKSTWVRRKGWPKLNFPPGGTMGRGEWFIQKKMAGFGALGDIGVHLLDLAWYLMGTPKPVSVTGMMWTKVAVAQLKKKKLPCEVDEMAAGTIRFEGGQMLTVDVCWDAYNEPTQKVRVFGDKGGASLFPAKVYRGEDIMETTELSTTFGGFDTVDPYEHFIDCVRNPKLKCIASGEENVQLIKMLDGIARSAETGKEVRLT